MSERVLARAILRSFHLYRRECAAGEHICLVAGAGPKQTGVCVAGIHNLSDNWMHESRHTVMRLTHQSVCRDAGCGAAVFSTCPDEQPASSIWIKPIPMHKAGAKQIRQSLRDVQAEKMYYESKCEL